MASDFDKPASGVWNVPESVLVAHGKSLRKEPTDVELEVKQTQNNGGKVAGDAGNKQTKGKIDVSSPYLPSSKETAVLAAAAGLDVLPVLLSSMYGATNLPYQYPTAPSGPISPFGLPVFSPFGLPFPPVPVSPLPAAANAGQSVFTTNKPQPRTNQRNTRQKQTKVPRRDSKAPKIAPGQLPVDRTLQMSFSVRPPVQSVGKALQSKVVNDKPPLTFPKPTPSVGASIGSGAPGSATFSDIASLIPVSQLLQSGLAPLLFNMNTQMMNQQPQSTESILLRCYSSPMSTAEAVKQSAITTKLPSTFTDAKVRQTAGGVQGHRNAEHSFKSGPPNPLVARKIPGAQEKSRHQTHVALNADVQDKRTRPDLAKQSSLGDAEAAAILLGLRHSGGQQAGRTGIGNTSFQSSSIPNPAQSGQRKRTAVATTSHHVPAKNQRLDNVALRPQIPSAEGAVDLSAKTSKARKLPRSEPKTLSTSTFVASVMDVPINPKIATVSQEQPRKQVKNKRAQSGSDSLSTKVKCDRKQQQFVSSSVRTDSTAESSASTVRHFKISERGRATAAASTSVVTKLPSCICAFDCRSPVEGYPATYETPEGIILKAQGVNNGGFNFKKAICDKFRQSKGADGQWYPVGECRDALLDDPGQQHGQTLETVALAQPASRQLTSSNTGDNSKARDRARATAYPQITQRQPGNGLKRKEDKPVFTARAHCSVGKSAYEKPPDRAIDFRVKKGSSAERQEFGGVKSIASTQQPSVAVQPKLVAAESNNVASRALQSRLPALSKAGSIAPTVSTSVRKETSKSLPLAITSSRQEITRNAPSFSDLRQKSCEFRDAQGLRQKTPASSGPDSFQAFSRHGHQAKEVKQRHGKLPVSNLYRIRNSGMADSNESLNSVASASDARADDTDGLSDSSCSSCESDYSHRRGNTNCSGSDVESEHGASDIEDVNGELSSEEVKKAVQLLPKVKSPIRPRFVLNRPKFTVNGGAAAQPSTQPSNGTATTKVRISSPKAAAVLPSQAPAAITSPGSKVKIRSPTFRFSTDARPNSLPSRTHASSHTELKSPAKVSPPANTSVAPAGQYCTVLSSTGVSPVSSASKVPELKCDEGENGQSFKAMFIRALSKSNQKEGLAVDGKSLRALLGEATYFYHNNRKYVLKRGLAKVKHKDGFIADVSKSKGMIIPATKKCDKDLNNNEIPRIRSNQPTIEPRVSVTATKRKKDRKKKKERGEKSKTHSHGDNERRSDEKTSSKDAAKKLNAQKSKEPELGLRRSDVTHKRHRRIHEIENLVFEGAGGATPIPDLSLRDSDVFSNIKLRRREAAKRGISENNGEERSAAATKAGKSSKSKDRKRRIKSAARERAAVNKTRKKSMEKKLRKYKKKNRIFLMMKTDEQPKTEHPRSSCVRINAGVARPHLEVQAYAAQEIRKFRKNSTSKEPDTLETNTTDAVTPVKLEASPFGDGPDETLPNHTATQAIAQDTYSDNADDISQDGRQPANDVDFSHGVDDLASQEDSGSECVEYKESECESNSVKTEAEADDAGGQRRYPKRAIKLRQSGEGEAEKKEKLRASASADDDPRESASDVTNVDTDSVRSESPFQTSTRVSKRKRYANSKSRMSPLTARTKNSKGVHDLATGGRNQFRLLSLFSAPSAVTLAPALGDLQPSYSLKNVRDNWTPGNRGAWRIGADALEIKNQMQRDLWRSMTLDMFTNGCHAKTTQA